MGFDEGRLIFDHENETYYTGQTVRGKLVFDQGKVKTFRGIYIKMKGYCNVHWTSSHTRKVNDRTEHYTVHHNSHESYFETKQYLIGGAQGECTIQPGHYEFPFQCHIPPHCPSSFESSNGHIRYEFKCVVDRSMKFDQEKERTITVIAQRDLNADPYCREPMEFEFHESYCCWCMSAGNCEILVKLPVSGYCPGQKIPIEVACANKSNVEIDTLKFEIKEYTKFRAVNNPDTRTGSDTVAKIKKGPVPPNTTRNWTVEMDLPQMDLYNVDACQYIDIYYEFLVEVSTGGCHTDTNASRRIIIGHIPLREYEEGPQQIPGQPAAPLQHYPPPPITNQPYPITSPYPSANPPYPGDSPYPGANPPYPGVSPYPGANPPYPGANPPYPGANPPYPGANPPYPGANPPYPSVSPYPGPNNPFPVTSPVPPTLGFVHGGDNKDALKTPLLPTATPMPYPTISPSTPAHPYTTASAPEPSTPDFEGKKPYPDNPPAYNPEFMKHDKPDKRSDEKQDEEKK